MPPMFALGDCNNFYVSCARVFQPPLPGKPVVVLSDNDGWVIARSEEAKALGSPMGLLAFQLEQRFPAHTIAIYSSNYALYGDMSARVMTTLAPFIPEVEVYSIDEAFLHLTGCGGKDLASSGRLIRHTVKRWTGIPISIGIGETKTLAKLANRIAKRAPDAQGIVNLTVAPHQDTLLATIPVQDVWGIGRRYRRLLHGNGIHTALELRDAHEQWIRQKMGVVGLRIVWELRGISCLPLALGPPPWKSVMVARSFGRAITLLHEMREAVATYTSRAAETLRRERMAAGILTVFLLTNRFQENEPQYHNELRLPLPVATHDTAELLRHALRGIELIFRQGIAIRKPG